jgi:hypothetical protein
VGHLAPEYRMARPGALESVGVETAGSNMRLGERGVLHLEAGSPMPTP